MLTDSPPNQTVRCPLETTGITAGADRGKLRVADVEPKAPSRSAVARWRTRWIQVSVSSTTSEFDSNKG
ncbi:uncharacterized protein METZ01_LOCUS24089, partial [marine metagenome]